MRYIIANWKMNPQSMGEAETATRQIAEGIEDLKEVEVVVCPPFPFLQSLTPFTKANLSLGAQNAFWEGEGAFTGEVSPLLLKNLGCEYVILGHSERKKYLGETSEMTGKKLVAAAKSQLRVILCSENSEELAEILKGVDKQVGSSLIAVYEPSFAISSSGKSNAESPARAREQIDSMRKLLEETFGAAIPVLYGGSVDATNIKGFLDEAGADGALVGHASLDPAEFCSLVKEASLR
ncbi:MAG: triose-phosphate isomerase [bacterium]|nr:triose-phosphate isomerase [bacterium]